MGGLCVKQLTYTNMTVLQLAASSEFRNARTTSPQSHSHVQSIIESLHIYLFMHEAQPVLDVSTFQRVVEMQRCHFLIGDGLIRLSRVIASVCPSISASTSKTLVSSSVAVDDFLTLLHIVVLLFLVFDVTRVPLVEHASEALLQFSFEAHPAPLFSDAD